MVEVIPRDVILTSTQLPEDYAISMKKRFGSGVNLKSLLGSIPAKEKGISSIENMIYDEEIFPEKIKVNQDDDFSNVINALLVNDKKKQRISTWKLYHNQNVFKQICNYLAFMCYEKNIQAILPLSINSLTLGSTISYLLNIPLVQMRYWVNWTFFPSIKPLDIMIPKVKKVLIIDTLSFSKQTLRAFYEFKLSELISSKKKKHDIEFYYQPIISKKDRSTKVPRKMKETIIDNAPLVEV